MKVIIRLAEWSNLTELIEMIQLIQAFSAANPEITVSTVFT